MTVTTLYPFSFPLRDDSFLMYFSCLSLSLWLFFYPLCTILVFFLTRLFLLYLTFSSFLLPLLLNRRFRFLIQVFFICY